MGYAVWDMEFGGMQYGICGMGYGKWDVVSGCSMERQQCSRTLHPKATRRKSMTLAEMGAEPVTMNRTLPPSVACTFRNTSKSHIEFRRTIPLGRARGRGEEGERGRGGEGERGRGGEGVRGTKQPAQATVHGT